MWPKILILKPIERRVLNIERRHCPTIWWCQGVAELQTLRDSKHEKCYEPAQSYLKLAI